MSGFALPIGPTYPGGPSAVLYFDRPLTHKRGDRVRIGKGRAVWIVLHGDTTSGGRVLVQSETSGRTTLADPGAFRPVQDGSER